MKDRLRFVLLLPPISSTNQPAWSPKYTPEALLREAATRLQDRFLFGSDYPFITPQRWMKDYEALDYFTPEARGKLQWKNAQNY